MIDVYKKKWIIFDLDNTIAQLGVDWPSCREEVKTCLLDKYPSLSDIFEKELATEGKLSVETMGIRAYQVLGKDVYHDFKDIQEKYEMNYTRGDMKVNNDVYQFIQNFSHAVHYAICSNNSLKGVEYALELLSVRDTFSVIEARIANRPPKPYPMIMDDLLKKITTDVSDCLYIGDNDITDKLLAEQVGMDYLDVKDFVHMTLSD